MTGDDWNDWGDWNPFKDPRRVWLVLVQFLVFAEALLLLALVMYS